MSNRYLEIACSNKSADNKMSFRNGISDLIFQIPAMNSTLIPSSVRVVGTLRIYKDGAKAIPATGDKLSIDSALGVYGAFQSLTTRSIRHQQTIEHIRHWSHMLKTYLPLSTKLEDNIGHLNETSLTTPNWNVNRESVVTHTSADFTGNHFSISLPCGLLNGTSDIPLSNNMLGGLEIKLALQPDSQFLYAYDGVTTGLTDAWYEFEDVKLVCEVHDYTPDQLSQMAAKSAGVFTYQSISSYYDTINSQNVSVNFNLGLSKVRSAFVTFVPSTSLNSYKDNGYATLMPVNTDGSLGFVRKVVWTKGGALYPKHLELNNNILNASSTSSCDPVLIRDYVSAVIPFVTNHNTMISPTNVTRLVDGDITSATVVPYSKIAEGGLAWGLGISYDQLGGSGSDFTTQQWGMNIDCNLITDNPISTFIFVNSEQSVVFNPNGIQVVQ